jgi:hypothetical protein
MEYNKYTGLRFIIPTMHLIMIDNNFIMKSISTTAVKDLVDVFNKCSKNIGSDVEASFDKDDFDNWFIQDYELDRSEQNIIIKDISRKRWYVKHMYSPVFKVYSDIIDNEYFMTEARKIVDRERKRQRYEVLKEKWLKSTKRLEFYEQELKKYSGDVKRQEYIKKQIEICKKENDINFFNQLRLSFESCNHVLVETIPKGHKIKINKNPNFHRPRFEYRCVKCNLTNKVYLNGDRSYYGPVGEIMYDLTKSNSGFSNFVYNEFNNSFVQSEPDVAEEIYNGMMMLVPRHYESNAEIIEALREETSKKENAATRVRSEK